MDFIKGSLERRGGIGVYISVFILAFLSFVATQLFCEIIAQTQFGFSLANEVDKENQNLFLTLMLLPFGAFLTVLLLLIKIIHQQPLIAVFTSRKKMDVRRVLTAFLSWGVLLMISLIISWFNEDALQWNFNSKSFIPLVALSFVLVPIQVLAEEVLFRSYLLQGFYKGFKSTFLSILFSGVLFGLVHLGNPEIRQIGYEIVFYYIFTGIFLGVITVMDDGLELAIGYHVINNVFGALIVTNEYQSFQTDALFMDNTPPHFGWENWLTLLVLQPLLIFVFGKIYKWKNWRSKLLR